MFTSNHRQVVSRLLGIDHIRLYLDGASDGGTQELPHQDFVHDGYLAYQTLNKHAKLPEAAGQHLNSSAEERLKAYARCVNHISPHFFVVDSWQRR